MGLTTAKFTLSSSTATKICEPDNESITLIIHNNAKSSNNDIYVGNATVGTADGFQMHEADFVSLTLPAGQGLWAVSNPDGLPCSVIRISN